MVKKKSGKKKSAGGDFGEFKLVGELLSEAVRAGASDVHLAGRPGDQAAVRFRKDGALHEVRRHSAKEHAAMAEQLRAMCQLDPDEHARPQDGRIMATIDGEPVDFRVNLAPCVLGDSITLRVLHRRAVSLDITDYHYSQPVLDCLGKLTTTPRGLFVLTGPTGTGKTTTLYCVLKQIAAGGRCKVVTIEDPVEFVIDGVEQTAIRPQAGATFPAMLRSSLRSDPDVLMVGEIRDNETAQVIHQAALTGHLVLTTLHTNFAPEVATRLINIGVPPFLVSSCLIASMSQRLVRRLRDDHRQPDPDAHEKLRLLQADDRWFEQTFYRPAGDPPDEANGYRGRIPINDVMLVDADIRKMITRKADNREFAQAMREKGMLTMLDDGLSKAAAGETSLDELLKVGLVAEWFA